MWWWFSLEIKSMQQISRQRSQVQRWQWNRRHNKIWIRNSLRWRSDGPCKENWNAFVLHSIVLWSNQLKTQKQPHILVEDDWCEWNDAGMNVIFLHLKFNIFKTYNLSNYSNSIVSVRRSLICWCKTVFSKFFILHFSRQLSIEILQQFIFYCLLFI